MSVRRRQVLAVAAASLALAVAGCSPMAMARKRRKRKVQQYLSGLDAVASARVEVHPELSEPDRWIADVRLKDDPSAESVATVVRDAYAEVLRLAGAGEARMVVTWTQGEASVFCYLPMKDADKAASATVEAVSVARHGASPDRGGESILRVSDCRDSPGSFHPAARLSSAAPRLREG